MPDPMLSKAGRSERARLHAEEINEAKVWARGNKNHRSTQYMKRKGKKTGRGHTTTLNTKGPPLRDSGTLTHTLAFCRLWLNPDPRMTPSVNESN